MIVAIYGRQFSTEFIPHIQKMIKGIEKIASSFIVYHKFYDFLCSGIEFSKPVNKFFNHNDLDKSAFCLISIGGDGTLLDTLTIVRDSGIPVLGINTGRLGFLSAVSADDISYATENIVSGNYRIDPRSILHARKPDSLFDEFAFALNELTVLKRDTTSMITIKASVNDQFLNTYWADGLIVATPTGSTGYSLSCGGPILTPESQNFVITPIASHNLTVRPLIIPDNAIVKISVEGRSQNYLLVLDSRSHELTQRVEIELCKAPYSFNLLHPGDNNFYQTIRNKLTWGLDKRN